MATLSHAESRRLYSWWWDSHISPKNSKWLQENLTDMDTKVKAMIKLIEEDADSFARRAEMYYKKRPELMKLVEEFYRAYRALAERYDHATGELRHAQRTMAEAFPNQIPFTLSDDSPSASSEVEPHTPQMPPPIRALLEDDDIQKDALDFSSHFHGVKRTGVSSDDSEMGTCKKGLKQLNEMFMEGRATKGLGVQEEEKKGSEQKLHGQSKDSQKHNAEQKEEKIQSLQEEISKDSEHKLHGQSKDSQKHNAEQKEEKIQSLQEEVSKLQSENHYLNSRVLLESERANRAETEVQSLQGSLTKLEMEKETALLQYQKCLDRISILEAQISRAKEYASHLDEENLVGATKLNRAEERCQLLDKSNQSLQLEVETLVQRTQMLDNNITKKDKELEKLEISVKEEQLHLVQAETGLQLLQNIHAQSEEQLRKLALELQNGVQKLKNVEFEKKGLEDEIQRIKHENHTLSEENMSAGLLINNLQGEIFNLNEVKRGLEEEVRLLLDKLTAVQQELYGLKEEIKDKDSRHQYVVEQVGSVGLTLENIQSFVRDLQDKNLKLKEVYKKVEDEKMVLMGKLEGVEQLSEKNSLLESSFLDANVEIDGLREKLKKLKESFHLTQKEMSNLQTEKESLISQVDNNSVSILKLSEKNTFLENSLSDLNFELDAFGVKYKRLEESFHLLQNENSNLLIVRDNLVSQIESIQTKLEDFRKRYAELEDQHSCFKEEKELMLYLVSDLQVSLNQEKEEHLSFIYLNKSQLANMEKQINLLQEEAKLNNRMNEEEQEELLNAEIEIFVLQSCIREMKDMNSFLSTANQKHVEASIKAEKLTSEFKQEIIEQKEKVNSLLENNDKLRWEIHRVLQSLDVDLDDEYVVKSEDQILLEQILVKFEKMHNSLLDSEDEIQRLLFEKSINSSLIEQLGYEASNLKSGKDTLEWEFKIRSEESSLLQREKGELLGMNKQLREDLRAGHLREETLKREKDVLSRQLLKSHKAYQTLSNENFEVLEENHSWKKEFCYLRSEKYILEEEYSTVLKEVMTLSYLSLVFESFISEKVAELQGLCDNLEYLRQVNNDLEIEIRVTNEKMGKVEIENLCLKEDIKKLEEYKSRSGSLENELTVLKSINEMLNYEIEIRKNLLSQKEMELSGAHQKLKSKETENIELRKDSKALKEASNVAQMKIDDLEKKLFTLSKDSTYQNEEIVHHCKVKEKLEQQMGELQKELLELKTREECLKTDLLEMIEEAKMWEMEAINLYKHLQISSFHALIFEGKAYNMIREYKEEVEKVKTQDTYLKSEVQKKANEIEVSETEAAKLYENLQISRIRAATFEEKAYELAGKCESIGGSTILQKKIFENENALKDADIAELRRKVGQLEGENEGIRGELSAVLPLIISLQGSVSSLEEQAFSLVRTHKTGGQEAQNFEAETKHDTSTESPNENYNALEQSRIWELQKLQAKVQAVEKALVEAHTLSAQERSKAHAKLEAAVKEIDELKSKSNFAMAKVHKNKGISIQLDQEEFVGPIKGFELGEDEAEVSCAKMKDIQLDHVSGSSSIENGVTSNDMGKRDDVEAEDQMLELWETAEKDCISKPMSKNPEKFIPEATKDAITRRQIETMEEHKIERELQVDKIEVEKKVSNGPQEGKKLTTEWPALDAQRLINLQKMMQELKENIDNSKCNNRLTGSRYDSLMRQLQELEQSVSQLAVVNSNLAKAGEEFETAGPDKKAKGLDKTENLRTLVLEQARLTKNIGNLELEAQKIQFVLIQLQDECEGKVNKPVERRARFLLRDYLYGRKKCSFCACVSPKTEEE